MHFVDSENLAIVIITFNPDKRFIDVLVKVRALSKTIIIVDNASKNILEIKKILNKDEILIQNINNYGIAKALNQGIQEALSQKKEWIMTLDQDSIPNEVIISYYNYVIKAANQNNENIALIGCSYNNKVVKEILFRKKKTLITSGLLHNYKIFDKVGYYKENFFIDYVDFEYSLRCNSQGFVTYHIQNNLLDHRLGENKKLKIGKLIFESTNHSAFRRYFIARNAIWTCRLYKNKYPKLICERIYNFLREVCLMCIVDDDRIKKIRATVKGVIDGITSKKINFE